MTLISYLTDYYEDTINGSKLSLPFKNTPTSAYFMATSSPALNNFLRARRHYDATKQEFKNLIAARDSINAIYTV